MLSGVAAMTSYRITVRRRTHDIAYIHCMTMEAIREALRELRYQYPRCFFVLQSIHT